MLVPESLVTPTGFYMLNSTAPSHRGVCAPGFVQSVGEDNSLLCLRKLSYPRDFVASIADPASYIDQSCGKWTSAKQIVVREEFDAQTVEDRLDHVARARGTTNLGKFRTSCKEMIATNSQGAALQKAYQQMRAGVGKIKMETS